MIPRFSCIVQKVFRIILFSHREMLFLDQVHKLSIFLVLSILSTCFLQRPILDLDFLLFQYRLRTYQFTTSDFKLGTQALICKQLINLKEEDYLKVQQDLYLQASQFKVKPNYQMVELIQVLICKLLKFDSHSAHL